VIIAEQCGTEQLSSVSSTEAKATHLTLWFQLNCPLLPAEDQDLNGGCIIADVF
jgi:hypothetical protein